MAKRIMAKIDTYTKDGQEKGKYIEVGVILSNDNGEYCLLHPHVDLSGLLIQQRILNPQKASKSVMCGIFDNDRQAHGQQQPQQAPPQQGGFDDDIPF